MTRGITAVGATLVITLVTWLLSHPLEPISTTQRIAQLMGALALVVLACMLLIATRWHFIDRLFAGQDKAYVTHKWLGITTLVLLAAHLLVLHAANLQRVDQGMLVHFGAPAAILFVALTAFALLTRKVPYESWKLIHLLTIVAYLMGAAHYYGASSYDPFGASPFSIWLNLTNLAGLCAVVYIALFYKRLGLRYRYRVTACQSVASKAIQITAEPVGKPLSFRPGQFAFISIPQLEFASHPFTISSAPGEALQFTVSSLGDDTARLVQGLSAGAQLRVSGPYGGFNYTKGSASQVWVAAGIGITPFRSFYRSGIPSCFSIDLFYTYRGEHDGVYLDELRAIDQPNLRIHLIDTTQSGRLTMDTIISAAPCAQLRDLYFCGPKPMRNALKKSARPLAPVIHHFNAEEFQFGRRNT